MQEPHRALCCLLFVHLVHRVTFSTTHTTSRSFLMTLLLLLVYKWWKGGEHRELVDRFVEWTGDNHLLPNGEKTKGSVIDFRKIGTTLRPQCIPD